ncbi:MAG: hypothetical protein ACK5NY_00085 [Burkholderiaceae bacterium]
MRSKYLLVKKLLCSGGVLVLTACAPQWRIIDSPAAGADQAVGELPFTGVRLQLPVGWLRAPVTGSRLLLTRDGLMLQQIGVRAVPLAEAFGGRQSGRPALLTPFELMQLELVELRSFNAHPVLQTNREITREQGAFPVADALPDPSTTVKTAAAPIVVGGVAGFDLQTQAFNRYGVAFRMRTVGLVRNETYWVFHYQAPVLHYYPATAAVFDGFLATVEFQPAPSAPSL